ncbi:MAG TPA: sigma factor [Dehalococcoidia bacterium]|nr:sigma factor [Dehalococcoidia bacterium]
MPPTKDFGEEVHQRLLQGDPTAPAEVIIAYLEPLIRRLRRRFPDVADETIIHDAATDALFQYVQSPGRFDPTKSSLTSYLTMAARGDVLNALARERRRATRQVPLETVAEAALARNTLQESEDSSESMAASPLLQVILQEVSDPADRELLKMILTGERKTAPYARALGITDQSEAEQRKIVKRHKDRLKKRLRRLRVRLREQKT